MKAVDSIVAGEKTVLSLGELVLTNTGSEPSITNMLDITIDSTKYDFVDTDNWRCNYPEISRSKVSCSLPYLDKSGTTFGERIIHLDLKLKSGYSLSPDIGSITMGLKLSTQCAGQQVLMEGDLTVPVEHHWTMKAVQGPDQSEKIYSWNSQDKDDNLVTQAFLSYDLYNTGPSMTQQSKLFVYMPGVHSSKGLLKDVTVTHNDVKCTIGDKDRRQRPPPSDTTAEEGTKVCAYGSK